MIDTYVKERMGIEDEEPEQYEEISDADRRELLHALKEKWADVNSKFQKYTVINLDTIGLVRRKESHENELKQIEANIEKLSRPGPLLVLK